MKEQIKKRIVAWKRLFTQSRTDVNEHSSWSEILKTLNLDSKEAKCLFMKAVAECKIFTYPESLYLSQLPYYQMLTFFIGQLPNKGFGDYFYIKAGSLYEDRIYCVRCPSLASSSKNLKQMPIIQATIILKDLTPFGNELPFDDEIYLYVD